MLFVYPWKLKTNGRGPAGIFGGVYKMYSRVVPLKSNENVVCDFPDCTRNIIVIMNNEMRIVKNKKGSAEANPFHKVFID